MNKRNKLIATSILGIFLFLGVSYNNVIDNPVSVTETASIGTTSSTSTTTTSTSTTTSTTTTSTSTTTSTTTTSTTTTSTSTTTSTTTTIPTTTTTVEVSPEKDSVTINDNNPVDPAPYEGVYSAFDGFEGENQTLLDSLVQNLPEIYKETLLEKISFINGCHPYGIEILGKCPFGVWDSVGTFKNGDTNADWKLSVWVSNRAFRSNVAFDTLLHESSHAFSYLNRNCVAPDGTNKRQQAQEYFGSEELFADSLVLYFGGDYVFYRETNSLSDAENAYLQEFINLCT